MQENSILKTINSKGLNSPEEKLAPTGKTYTLERIMTISTAVWFFVAGFIIVIGYFGIKVFGGDTLKLFDNSAVALVIATGIIVAGMGYLRKISQKEKVLIEITDKNNLIIYFDGQIKISSPVSDLVKIFTIHRINKKPDVQAKIIFKKGTINLYGAGNHTNKQTFDDFILFLEKEFKFTFKKAPFSLR
jgi:hypothetical protein